MRSPFKIFKIQGHSMEPALPAGSFVLVYTWTKNFKPRDIIAFNYDDKILIKRIKNINQNNITVTGDNIKDSLDSIRFGDINIEKIVGKVIAH